MRNAMHCACTSHCGSNACVDATVRNGTYGTERDASKTPEEIFGSHIAGPVDNSKSEVQS